MLGLSLRITRLGRAAAAVVGTWILATGAWNDSGQWDDTATWSDA